MRPYLAILHDSFRFALSSRVLLVMLVLISVFLLVTAPLGYKEQLTTEIFYNEITNPHELALQIARGAELDEQSAERRVWDRLSPNLRRRTVEFAEATAAEKDEDDDEDKPEAPNPGSFLGDFNKMLADRTLYSAEAWPRERLVPEARGLIDKGVESLNDEQVGRLNRLLLEATFPNLIQRGPATSIRFVYWPVETGWVIPMRIETVREFIGTSLPKFIDKFLLSIGLLVAALVTAPLIPQTFEPGALTLQLSKPISRSLLFLAKFVGGCAFTFLCATYLFIGLMLVLGLRWGLWEPKILWCIPIYVFVFAIYYTVSALAGLIWRNTVVAIILVIGFWLMCWLLGFVHGIWQDVLDVQRFKHLAVVGDDLIAIDEMNVPRRWDEATDQWQATLLSESEERQVSFGMFAGQLGEFVGPVSDPKNERLILVKGSRRNWNFEAKLGVASADDGFQLRTVGEAPFGTFLVAPEADGNILAVSSDGTFYRVSLRESGEAVDLPDDENDRNAKVETAGPVERFPLVRPFAAAVNMETGVLAVYSRGTISLFQANDQEKYERIANKNLDVDENALVSLAYAGDSLLVAQNDGRLLLLSGESLAVREAFEPETSTGPRHVRAAPGGKWFAVAYHSGNLWLIDAEAGKLRKANVKGQGEISAVEFSGPARLLVCDGSQRVYEYSVDDQSLQRRYSAKMGMGERLYRWIVLPVYTVAPKPREFHQTTQYLWSGKKSAGSGGPMDQVQEEIHPWQPVWSSAIFIVVMLGLGCLYVERQEF